MRLRLAVAAFVIALATSLAPPAWADSGAGTGALAPLPAGCPVGWGSLAKRASGMSPGFIKAVRVGHNACFDRLVLDIDGPLPGFTVQYVSLITEDASGRPLVVPGGARLLITVRTNGHSIDTGRPTLGRIPSVAGFPTFQGLILAGDFEGITSFGLGTRARLPFRVLALRSPNRIVIDVAHNWR